mmetsp:Transcript_3277/g.13147  ORF Transcript_3277/g.13147 Transcript_3277/m.13147 type:complete len:117 (-) Transcript_3277:775-1125(-)|eukprot:scaffold470_cov257-Pinguiococcus_pyrenoidosus.AAC.7
MVRNIVGFCEAVAAGELELEDFHRVIALGDRTKNPAKSAAPEGLLLAHVAYADFGPEVQLTPTSEARLTPMSEARGAREGEALGSAGAPLLCEECFELEGELDLGLGPQHHIPNNR